MVIGHTSYRNVHGFTPREIERMLDYLLGAVQVWCRARHGEWFAARDLLGGANYYWQGTPLMRLYEYYMEQSDEDDVYSVRQAGRAAGHLLKDTMISTSTVLIDRNKTGDFQMPLRRGGQDYATWLMLMRNGTLCYGLNEVLSHYRVMSKSLSSNKWKSVKQVWEIQTQNEKINKVSAAFNVCCFIVNAFIKHFLH